jgi:hypothetical protein
MNLIKLERYLRVNLLGPGPRQGVVSQRLRNTVLVNMVNLFMLQYCVCHMKEVFFHTPWLQFLTYLLYYKVV